MYLKKATVKQCMKKGIVHSGTLISKEAILYLVQKAEDFIVNVTQYAEIQAKSHNRSTIKLIHIAETLDKVSLVLKIYPKVGDVAISSIPKTSEEVSKVVIKHAHLENSLEKGT
jgi:histone H3/H4